MQGTSLKLAVGVVAGLGAVSGVALAAGPDEDGSITACYQPSGLLRVVESASGCRKNETALTWNQAGPQGPPGPAGPVGPQGPPGDSGIASVYTVEGTMGVAGGLIQSDHVSCAADDPPISGGFQDTDTRVKLVASRPVSYTDGSRAWEFTATHDDPVEVELDLYVVCLSTG